MRERYAYNGQNITMDVVLKTEDVVRQIAEKEGRPFDECLASFTATRVCRNLRNAQTQMWAESAEYIVDEYFRETQGHSF